MPVSPDVLVEINNATLENFLDKGKVWKQNVQNKPLLQKLNAKAGAFAGGKEFVSFAVRDGRAGGVLQGYSFDDQVAYYDPATMKRARFPWKEHHIGVTLTHTELKMDGIDVTEDGSDQSTNEMSGREQFALANRFDEVMDTMAEDYAFSLNRLLWGDGTSDAKAIAGIQSIILPNPLAGSTGSIARSTTPYWRNRARTAAYAAAVGASTGPQGGDAVTSSPSGGGALIDVLEIEDRQLQRYRKGTTGRSILAGSDFISAYLREMRANGYYTQDGWRGKNPDGSMGGPQWRGTDIEYDPTLDDLGLSKRAYFLDLSTSGIRLLYMNGNRMKKHNPARPYDRYVLYNGVTMTGVLTAKQLNTSLVIDVK